MQFGTEFLKESFKKFLGGTLCITLVIFATLMILPKILSWFEHGELYNFDQRQSEHREDRSKSNINIIEVDDQSLSSSDLKKAFGRYPFRREVFGYLIRYLEAGNAKQLIMDMAFNGGDDLDHPDSDDRFAEAINSKLEVTTNLATISKYPEWMEPPSVIDRELMFNKLKEEWVTFDGALQRSAFGIRRPVAYVSRAIDIQPSIQKLLRTRMKFFPFENLIYDINGKARRTILFTQISDRGILPTLPVSPLLWHHPDVKINDEGHIRLNDRWVNLRGESSPIIRWYGNELTYNVYPRFSFWQIIKSQVYFECQEKPEQAICQKINFKNFQPVNPELFANKYIFFGLNSYSYDMDNHSTLYDNQGRKYPGLYIQANIFDNLMHDDFVGRAGWRIPIDWNVLSHIGYLREFRYFDSISLVTLLTVALMIILTSRFAQWSSVPISIVGVVVLGLSYNYLTIWAYEKYNLWINWIYPMTAMIISFSGAFVFRYVQSEKKKHQLRIAFGKYFPKEIMDEIVRDPEKIALGGQRMVMTFLFCDIRGFTTFAENHDTDVVQRVLNDYYTRMHDISRFSKGTAFKFLGDGILTFWGFPKQSPDDPFFAVKAAFDMKKSIEEWDSDPGRPQIRIGIGINTGEAFFGNVGTDQYMDFTVIGDNVNIASRLQEMNKEYGTTIIISEATYERVKDRVDARVLGLTHIRGKEQEIRVYEAIGLKVVEPA